MKNMRRAMNRRSGKLTEFREPEHNDMSFRPSNTDHQNFGSPRSYGRVGTGPVAGAGELAGMQSGPGPLTRRIAGMPQDMFASQVGSTSMPPNMDVIAEGEGPRHPRRRG